MGRLPIDALAPGTYDLRVVVTDGTAPQLRSVLVRIRGSAERRQARARKRYANRAAVLPSYSWPRRSSAPSSARRDAAHRRSLHGRDHRHPGGRRRSRQAGSAGHRPHQGRLRDLRRRRAPDASGPSRWSSRAGGIGIQVRRRAPGMTTSLDARPPPEAAETQDRERPPTTALVFDSLTPEALGLAQTAALAELPMNGRAPGRIGVFSGRARPARSPALHRGPRARRLGRPPGVGRRPDARTHRGPATHRRSTSASAARRAVWRRRRRPPALSARDDNSSAAQAIVEQQMTKLEMRMLRTFETLDRDHRGFGTANALLSVIQSLAIWPGARPWCISPRACRPRRRSRPGSTRSSAPPTAPTSASTRSTPRGCAPKSTLSETRREIDGRPGASPPESAATPPTVR